MTISLPTFGMRANARCGRDRVHIRCDMDGALLDSAGHGIGPVASPTGRLVEEYRWRKPPALNRVESYDFGEIACRPRSASSATAEFG